MDYNFFPLSLSLFQVPVFLKKSASISILLDPIAYLSVNVIAPNKKLLIFQF